MRANALLHETMSERETTATNKKGGVYRIAALGLCMQVPSEKRIALSRSFPRSALYRKIIIPVLVMLSLGV